MESYNVVVGAGISGATIAYLIATELKEPVTVVERRPHVGGNCYDFYDEHGILLPLYGPHFFHTNSERVWSFVHRFSDWNDYQHRVLSRVDDMLVPVPVNITTVNKLFGTEIETPAEMQAWLEKNSSDIPEPKNSEEAALNLVGPVLYEKMFKNYTMKQWERHPRELAPQVMARIPVRTDFEDRYFTDPYQGMPTEGYTALFRAMLDHPLITVQLSTDYFSVARQHRNAARVFFTGRIDQFFEGVLSEELQYRSVEFEFEHHDTEWYQGATTVNYPDRTVPWTRITEPKRATGQLHPTTTVVKEYPRADGDPYYPVFTPENERIFSRYQELAKEREHEGVYFLGRLAQYKYFNMDQAFLNALEFFENLPW